MTTLTKSYEQTSLGWQQANLKIISKSAKLVSLIHNRAQLRVHNTKQLQIERELPVRLIICKARRRGVSTGEEADMFEDINRKQNRYGCVASLDTDSTNVVFNMCKVFQDEIPDEKKRLVKRSNRKEIAYAPPHRSSILCQTAGKDVLGRGGTLQIAHLTEVAFWPRAKQQLGSFLPQIPRLPDTCVTIESTSFGTTGEFHDKYWTAVDRLRHNREDYNGYLPIFLSWQDDPEYQMPLPTGYELQPYTDHEIYGDEQHLIHRWGLTPEQLYWRRYTIREDFNCDLAWFMQEYPATAKESFQGTGRMVFLPSKIDYLEKRCHPPIANIEFYEEDGNVKYRNVLRTQNCWSIWAWPERDHEYCQFGDVAEGKASNTDDPRSDSDRSVSIILDRNAFRLPAVYYGRPDTIQFGDQMLFAAKYFNWAWSSPEMNSIGQSILDTFKRAEYSYVYQRERKEDSDNTEDSDLLGWKTTGLTRPLMLDYLIDAVHEDNCELHIMDQRIINEMRTFITNKQGKKEHDAGEFDDCVMALAGVLQLHMRCPMQNRDRGEEALMKEDKPKLNAGEVMGSYDTELDDEDEFEEAFFDDEQEELL